MIAPSGVLIDLGCAHGYLVEQARTRGYQTFGFDISSYALAQEPTLRPRLAQAHLQHLPLRDRCADVVAVFDVLEHLDDPLECLAEAARVLKPEGLIVGATPDPLFFDRKEQTHFFERPPSYWIAALDRLNLQVQFRFSTLPYNFQFLAAARGSRIARRLGIFQHDFFDSRSDFVRTAGPVTAVPRCGWGPLTALGRATEGSPACLYLLNPTQTPLRLGARLSVSNGPAFATLRIRFDSYVLKELYLHGGQVEHEVDLPETLLPSGGHHWFFDLFPSGTQVNIDGIEISGEPAPSRDLTLGLPFDLFQRYRLAGQVASILSPAEILDVGGHLGDQDGHLATAADFVGVDNAGSTARSVQTTDIRHCDHPAHAPAEACKQPFDDRAFDLVICLDVIEHLPEERRLGLLAELDRLARRWILVAAPFASAEVAAAERSLIENLLPHRHFLQEHHDLGLPETRLVEKFFESERGYALYCLPNGYLSRWKEMQILTQHYFGMHDYVVFRGFNRIYNQNWFPFDQAEPCYRKVFLVCKEALTPQQRAALEALRSVDPRAGELVGLSSDPLFLEVHKRINELGQEQDKALHDLQFLINERQKLIGYLQKDIGETPLWKLAARRLSRK